MPARAPTWVCSLVARLLAERLARRLQGPPYWISGPLF